MDRKPRKTSVKANALTAPRPRRVSVCRAGANQTPLNAAKGESIVVEKKELDTMLTSMKAQGFDIAEVAFSGDQWNRAAVDGWMADGGYSGFAIDGMDGAYTVKSDTVADAEGERRTVKTGDGVSVTLVKTESTEEESEGDPAEGAGSQVQPVAKAEGVGGIEAAKSLIERCKAAAVPQERAKSLYTVSQFADLIRSLKWLVSEMSWDDTYASSGDTSDDGIVTGTAGNATREQIIGELKAMGQQLLDAFASLVSIEVGEFADAFKSATEDTMTDTTKSEIGTAPIVDTPTEQIAPVLDTPVVEQAPKDETGEAAKTEGEPAPVAEAEPAAKTDEPVADAAPAWFTAFADQITTSVKSLTERVDGLDAPKGAEKSAETEITTVIPVQKSADAPEQSSGSSHQSTEKAEKAQRFESARLKAALGL